METPPWVRVLQLLAALGFAAASMIFALETQDSWLLPAPGVLGWHVGFWNFLGSCGLGLFAAFTLAPGTGAESSSSVHYFWGECMPIDIRLISKTDNAQAAGAFWSAASSNGTRRWISIPWSGSKTPHDLPILNSACGQPLGVQRDWKLYVRHSPHATAAVPMIAMNHMPFHLAIPLGLSQSSLPLSLSLVKPPMYESITAFSSTSSPGSMCQCSTA